MNKPKYRGIPILHLETLAAIAKMPVGSLRTTINNSYRCYRANTPIVKPNGSVRQIYTVLPPLDSLQDCILHWIFHQVKFPPYLQGSIKFDGTPRGYIENAALHAPYRSIIRDDIQNFFPSIGYNLVLSIWHDFFGFPTAVARALTQATTYQGKLPQGASTSSYIANLVFWDTEYQLVNTLKNGGYIYTRYVDDINVSSNKPANKEAVTFVRGKVYGMLRSKGFKPNRRKGRVQTRAGEKTVHGLNINAGRPTMDRKERSRIRAAVKQCEDMAKVDRSSEAYRSLYLSTLGRVDNMRRLHKQMAQSYHDQLLEIQPIET